MQPKKGVRKWILVVEGGLLIKQLDHDSARDVDARLDTYSPSLVISIAFITVHRPSRNPIGESSPTEHSRTPTSDPPPPPSERAGDDPDAPPPESPVRSVRPSPPRREEEGGPEEETPTSRE